MYLDFKMIRAYIEKHYEVKYSCSGIIAWLYQYGFSYKKSNKAPPQEEFIKAYDNLKSQIIHQMMLFSLAAEYIQLWRAMLHVVR